MASLLRSADVRGPVGWRDHRVIVLDGTDLAGTEPRLKPLRGIKAAGLPQSTSDPNAHFVLFTKAVATDLGNLGGKSSTAYAVNSAGQFVGTSQTTVANPYKFDLNSHALLATGCVMKDLGTLGGNNSVAYAINAQGTAVGASDVVPNAGFWTGNLLQNQHAFISNGSNMVDLNSLISDQLNLTLNSAVAINSAGQSLAAGQAGTKFSRKRLPTDPRRPADANYPDARPRAEHDRYPRHRGRSHMALTPCT